MPLTFCPHHFQLLSAAFTFAAKSLVSALSSSCSQTYIPLFLYPVCACPSSVALGYHVVVFFFSHIFHGCLKRFHRPFTPPLPFSWPSVSLLPLLFLSSFMVSSNLRDSLLYSPSTSSSSLPSRLSPCFLLSSRLHLPHWHLTISLLLLSPFFRFPTVNWLLLALFYLFCLLHPPDWHWQNKPLVSLILQYHPYCVFFVIVFLSYSFQIHIHSSLPSTVSSLSASFPSSLADLSHSSISFPPNPSFSAYSSLASSNIALC